MNIVFNLIEQFTDPWVLFGFLAQFVFFLRFVVQWLASEKEKKNLIELGVNQNSSCTPGGGCC